MCTKTIILIYEKQRVISKKKKIHRAKARNNAMPTETFQCFGRSFRGQECEFSHTSEKQIDTMAKSSGVINARNATNASEDASLKDDCGGFS